MIKQKRVVAIHDISCFGKCSLTVALPVLSAAGIETCPIPTSLLSTHTGGFTDIHIVDLTDHIQPVLSHWESLNLEFEAVYTGYLGSFRQLDIVSEAIDKLKGRGAIALVDPVMGDNGRLYGGFTDDFPKGMLKLCAKADIITPNFTEAAFMLGEEYIPGPYTEEYVSDMLAKLSEIGAGTVVLTGVHYKDSDRLGAAAVDCASGEMVQVFSRWIPGNYHGTGDVFASTLLAALMNGKDIKKSLEIATGFVSRCVMRTRRDHQYMNYSVNFEAELPSLMRELEL